MNAQAKLPAVAEVPFELTDANATPKPRPE